MKAIRYIAILILAAALAACGEKSEPYYTTSYPVSRVEATVTLGAAATATAEDEPEPEPEHAANRPVASTSAKRMLSSFFIVLSSCFT